MTERNASEQWGWFQFAMLIFLGASSFSILWVLFIAFAKMNGFHPAQRDWIHFRTPLIGKVSIRWWEVETILLIVWTIGFTILAWIRSRWPQEKGITESM